MDFFNKHEEQLGRGLTYDLWKNFPIGEILVQKDGNVGVGCMLNQGEPPYAAVSQSKIVAGNGAVAFTDSDARIVGLTHAQYDGGQGVRFGGTTDNHAAELQWCGQSEQFVISDTAADIREFILESTFRISSIAAEEMAFFIGLAGQAALDGDFLADDVADENAIADVDLVGIFMDHPALGVMDTIYQIAGTATTVHEAAWKTLVIDTWYTFGMRYRPESKKLDLYWGPGDRATKLLIDDNPILSTDISGADFPDGQGMAPMIAFKAGGTAEYLDIRSFAAATRVYGAD